MMSRLLPPAGALGVLLAMAFVGAAPSYALSSKECSARYQAAKAAGTLNGLSWNDYRKKECAGVDDASTAKTETKPEVKPTVKTDEKPAAKTATATPPTGIVFPKAIDPKYAKESAGRARMHTCRDQYQANKANNGNAGQKWIQKGGGYYSLCNSALKGA